MDGNGAIEAAETDKLYQPNRAYTLHRTLSASANSSWTSLLILTGVVATLGISLSSGYNIGVINNPAAHIAAWCNQTIQDVYGVLLTPSQLEYLWSGIVSIFLIGGAVGSLGGAFIADRLGRKGSYLATSLLFIAGALCFQFCRALESVELLVVGRLLVGLAAGLTTSVVPMYLCEIAPLQLRGTFAVLCPIGLTGGVVIGQICSLEEAFGTPTLWQFALSTFAALVILCLLPYPWLPESPKYLFLIAGRREQAEAELLRLRGNADSIYDEMESMRPQASTSTSETRSLCSVLRDPTLRLPLILVCALQGGQQMSGINAVFYYSVKIFQSVGLTPQQAKFSNLGAGCINLLVAFITPLLMARVNRRPLIVLSVGLSGLFLFILTFVIRFQHVVSWFPYASIAAVFAYIIVYQLGLGPIPYFIAAELFEVSGRSAGMALGSLSSWTGNFVVGFLFPTLQTHWGAFVFLPFTINCVLLALLCYFYLPETRGRDAADVAPLMVNGFRSKVMQSA